MGLVNAKCTNCGGVLQVEESKDAAICPFCNSAYIVEKAINNYNINVTNNVSVENATINMNGGVVQVTENVDIDNLLQRGKEYLKFYQFDDAEKCFLKVLEKDADNECAKKGMVVKSLITGCIKYEEAAYAYMKGKNKNSPIDEAEWAKIMKIFQDDGIYKASSYLMDIDYFADFVGMRAAKYEKKFRKSNDYAISIIMMQYYMTANEYLKAIKHDNAWPDTALKRRKYYLAYKPTMFGKSWEEYISESELQKQGLMKQNEKGEYLYYCVSNSKHMLEMVNEFRIETGDKMLSV